MAIDCTDLVEATNKIRDSVPELASVRLRALAGLPIFDRGALDELLPTALIISAVSILDDAFERLLNAEYAAIPRKQLDSHGKRAAFLAHRGRLHNPAAVEALRNRRNGLAHDRGVFATWEELRDALSVVSAEIAALASSA